ncbi:MAG: putative lipid II flippase FtsW [Clostridiales bacterium]|nr:putative lipid II flippase FtsW [Clostridiales bacterium]
MASSEENRMNRTNGTQRRRRTAGQDNRLSSARGRSGRKTEAARYRSITHERSGGETAGEEYGSVQKRVKYNVKNILNIGGIKIRYGAFDYQFLFTTIILVAFGLVMLYSASSSRSYASTGDSLYFVKGQLGGLVMGLVAMVACMVVDYHVLVRFSPIVYGIGLVLLILVLIPGVGTTTNGATRWVFGFQPSELMKFAMIIVVAYYLDSNQKYLGKFFRGFCPCLLILAFVAVLLMMEPHFSATILVGFTTVTMMFVAGAKLKHFGILAVPVAVIGVVMIAIEPYRLTRILSFLDPFADKQGAGWQIVQSLYAIGSGGIFGVGFGKSRQKFMSLPEPHNDFIFSVLAEELGWIGAIIVIVLFAYLVYRGIRIALKAPDLLGRLIVMGVVALIGIQAVINIGVVTASLPVTGMPLPFFSYGGTALTFTLAEIGLVLNVSRQERLN